MIASKKIKLFVVAALCAGAITTSSVGAANPIKLLVNGNELDTSLPAENRDGTIIAPVRPLAEVLGAEVRWDGVNNSVLISGNKSITHQQVADLITEQGKEKDYYLEGLSYQFADLNGDGEQEIVAMIDGAVHLGNFFVFAKTKDGSYKLIKEENWKVDNFTQKLVEVNGKKIFEIVERTGGTGLDIHNAHLWYIDNGRVIEAWQGVLKELNAMLAGSYSLKLGSYYVDADTNALYSWESTYELDDDTANTMDKPNTIIKKFTFDGTKFVEE